MIKQLLGTLQIFCRSSFKSHCQKVFKTPLTLFKGIFLVHLVAVQSSGIFKNVTKIYNNFVVKILKIPKIWQQPILLKVSLDII